MDAPDATNDSERLVDRARSGDGEAIGELLQRHLAGLRAFIRLRASDQIRARESCSDLAQSVCREVLQNIERFQFGGEAGFKDWLYATALRKIVNRHEYYTAQKRDHGREVRLSTPVDSHADLALTQCYRTLATPSREVSAREALEITERAFDRLPEHYREVIVLARLVGLSRAEIGAKMGRSESAIRSLLSRALAELAELVEESP